ASSPPCLSSFVRPGLGGRDAASLWVPEAPRQAPRAGARGSPPAEEPTPKGPAGRPLKSPGGRADANPRNPLDMQPQLVSLFLQYARLDRKRTLEGLSTAEAARLAELEATLARALQPHVPRGAERRNSIRVPTELACRW